jgi:hypothetical protein
MQKQQHHQMSGINLFDLPERIFRKSKRSVQNYQNGINDTNIKKLSANIQIPESPESLISKAK